MGHEKNSRKYSTLCGTFSSRILVELRNNMSDDNEDFKNQLKKMKPKKPKLSVPEEFLDNAKSYEDKQMLVQLLTEKEKQRVVLIVKNMLKDAVAKKDRK